ncbi:MAG: hypothetical protein AB2693_11600, partial [Candidatus Thiodiazotropha sp.]
QPIFSRNLAHIGVCQGSHMFEETPRNKMLKELTIQTFLRESYLAIFDIIKLEFTFLLRMRRKNFCFAKKGL